MKRVLVAASVAAAVLGCSDNTLTIKNMSDCDIRVTFRAKEYSVAADTGYTEVKEVSNGTYAYGTVYSLTSTARAVGVSSVEEGEGLHGDLTFERSETQILLIYGSAPTDTTRKTIKLWGAWSSSEQSTGALTAP